MMKKAIAWMVAIGVLCCGCSAKEISSSSAAPIQPKAESATTVAPSSSSSESGHSSASSGNSEGSVGITAKKAQEILDIWASFGGNPPDFSDVNDITASEFSQMYTSYCISNNLQIAISEVEPNQTRWIDPKAVNEWINKYFGIDAAFIDDNNFNTTKGYKYPVPLANAADDKTILEYEERENQITIKAQYDFILPPELYEGGGKRSTICTVTASVTNDNIHFISATKTPLAAATK